MLRFAIGIVGDAGVRGTAQQPRLFVGMILILIFAEVLGKPVSHPVVTRGSADIKSTRPLRAHRGAADELQRQGRVLKARLGVEGRSKSRCYASSRWTCGRGGMAQSISGGLWVPIGQW